jgi:hypothetical protein
MLVFLHFYKDKVLFNKNRLFFPLNIEKKAKPSQVNG